MRARLHLIKQPNVFNRYHRLIGKCGEKFDLLVGKWLYFHATNKDRTNCLIVSQQRHRQYCSMTDNACHLGPVRKLIGTILQVMNVDRLTINESASRDPPTLDRPSIGLAMRKFRDFRWNLPMMCFETKMVILA